ncbi:PQQ-binding-like beta-propeller repeat protein [candidate division KSB1 bacterium]|nr:PQQ-binding-like beta-propeller repeat protein [candidate division KSB1 bacterium]NIV69434.1 PQQ-binding-like beta-propeller repeat protein [Phycisphaerae bacterium]NIR70732.1 PQQ-binding-like beta-propeller repeat protein [candidate division KSB1 bacterium]NIS27789.1 PQQ-binding-like beta-propeller repeat protein [candidate division KSB1 bacterium]NIT74637.1 PQQ-binding-like beta-propeller repeat protein [candidate division KSB1 bacterium]
MEKFLLNVRLNKFSGICLSVLIWSFGLGKPALSDDSDNRNNWPRWRGNNFDGIVSGTGVIKSGENYRLKIVWKKPLGSGCSSVSVADDRAVTMFSDGTFDDVIAFDAQSGVEIWRFKIDSTYKGHDGSYGGPISTPLISGNKVYGIGPKGQLFALDVKTGKEIWSSHLENDHDARVPFYGFATSPVVDSDVLIVETGGKNENAIAGFDKDTGERLWATGTDIISYQSPIRLNIHGQNQVLCVGDRYLCGLEPKSGRMLWEYSHKGGGNYGSKSMNPVIVGDNRLFLKHSGRGAILVEINKKDDEFIAEEVWTTRNIRMTYDIPIYFDGYLYGYSNRFLTCLDVKTGESVWKSRQPGDGFLILVDGHLVIVTKKGTLHIAKAGPQAYYEIADLKLFDKVAWTPASFANGKIYARSHSEIACIDIVKIAQVARAETEAEVVVSSNSEFVKFVKKLNSAQNKNVLIDEFMNSHEQFPVIEGDSLVHLIYLGDANDMALVSDVTASRHEAPMKRVAETNFFYYSVSLEPDARMNYRFVRNFEENITDPLNSRKVASISGESSWVSMPNWEEPKHLVEPEGMKRGRIDTLQFESKLSKNTRRLDVYLPADYDESETRYPVAYVHWGVFAQKLGKMQNTVDNLIGRSVSPVIVVFIPRIPRSGMREFMFDLREEYAQMFVEELVPFVDKNYRTMASPRSRANIGMGYAGFMSFYSTFQYPGNFGKVSGQSTFLDTAQEEELKSLVSDSENLPLQIYLDWGKYDMRGHYEAWSLVDGNRSFATFLKERGYMLTGGEVNDGFSWASWRNRTNKVLETFFPLEGLD